MEDGRINGGRHGASLEVKQWIKKNGNAKQGNGHLW